MTLKRQFDPPKSLHQVRFSPAAGARTRVSLWSPDGRVGWSSGVSIVYFEWNLSNINTGGVTANARGRNAIIC